MKRDLLAKSLEQMGSKAGVAGNGPPNTDNSTPKSLKSMSDVLAQVSAESAQDVSVDDIADSKVTDRFNITNELDDLYESIRTSGQRLPVLLRYRRGPGPRYEVVYGRRRIAACRSLGITVKAYVKEMDQREALVSQALENTARLERSFIEQAVFATQLEQEGFKRPEICDVLAVDKGTLSKLIGVARDIPDDVIYKIGAAHDAGRRPWLELRKLTKSSEAPSEPNILSLVPDAGSSVEKLNGTISALQAAIPKEGKARVPSEKPDRRPARLTKLKNAPITLKAYEKRLMIEVSAMEERDFISFVEDNLEGLYTKWKNRDV